MKPIEAFLAEHDTAVDLEFMITPTGKVHIVDPLAHPEHPPTFTIQYMLGRTRTACGLWLRHILCGGDCDGITTFPDNDLCGNCHRTLGTQAARAFEHPTPHP